MKTPANKSQPGGSDVHVPAPMGNRKKENIFKKHFRDMMAKVQKEWGSDGGPDDGSVDNLTDLVDAPKQRHVSTVAVMHDNHLLMGKRRDNGKWTVPGGHANEGEDSHSAALRELEEESGIKVDKAEPLAESKEVSPGLTVQPFKVQLSEKPATSMKEDPDGEVNRWNWIDVSDGLPKHIAENMHVPPERNILMHSLELYSPLNNSDVEVLKSTDDAWDFQDVVEGMDWELGHGESDEQKAYEIVCAALEKDPSHYKELFEREEGEGYCVDIGSGTAREPGFLGVDSYPYDHGTLVHDISMGVPFSDSSVSKARLVNSLHEFDDPQAVLKECVRVLKAGGELVYEGPEKIEKCDGLTMKSVACADGVNRQVFVKGDAPDEMLAMSAYDQPMVSKSKVVRIMKANAMKQIVYGVVLAPNEIDTQDEFMSAEEIEKTAHAYLEKSRIVGAQHTKPVLAVPVESFIAPQDMEWDGDYGPQTVKKGSWVLGVKIIDRKEWQKVLNGDYTGFSVGGFGLRTKIESARL